LLEVEEVKAYDMHEYKKEEKQALIRGGKRKGKVVICCSVFGVRDRTENVWHSPKMENAKPCGTLWDNSVAIWYWLGSNDLTEILDFGTRIVVQVALSYKLTHITII